MEHSGRLKGAVDRELGGNIHGCLWLFLVVFGCFEVYFLESHRSVFFRIPWKAAERPPRICDDFLRFRRESRPASGVDFFQQKKTYNFKKRITLEQILNMYSNVFSNPL